MLIDTHSHIYLEEFDKDIDEVISRAKQNGVTKIVLPNIDKTSVQRLFALAKSNPQVCFTMMGLYPGSVEENVEEQLSEFSPLVKQNDVVAIGEIGLDFYWNRDYYEQQIYAFNQHLSWSKDLGNKPLCIHCRKAFDEILQCLKEDGRGSFRGVFHCFSGDINQAKKVVEMGFLLGIGGVLTFKNAHLAQVVKHMDLKHIVLETDAPYLAPVPYRGKRNEPAYIKIVAEKIAEIKEIPFEQVAEQTTYNAEQLFGI
ncbi:MAG: TatD family hydrolase [Bacteroidota bacterium]|nr:TatD family hydrolase [Bacteroidota bacterium]